MTFKVTAERMCWPSAVQLSYNLNNFKFGACELKIDNVDIFLVNYRYVASVTALKIRPKLGRRHTKGWLSFKRVVYSVNSI